MAEPDEQKLADAFLAWAEEGEIDTSEAYELRWGQLRVETEVIAVLQLERLAEFRNRAERDETFWFDAIRSAHLALTAVMVTALEGPGGVGAMRERAASRVLEYLNKRERVGIPFPREETMSFAELLTAVQTPGRLQYGNVIILSDDEQLRAKELNWMRELIDHPKFTRWSVPIEDMDAATKLAGELFEKIMECAAHRFDRDAHLRVQTARRAIAPLEEHAAPE